VLGIAFFAQWSFLSNITAGIIIFFNHPIRLGDQIRIVEKDFFIEGKVTNISFFFMHLENEEKEQITIPNSIALQKTIVVL
jgi:small-conductance mechanosensitive channel